MDYELTDYLESKDKAYLKLVQNSGRAQANIIHSREMIAEYHTKLSPDAVPSPEFIRAFCKRMDAIVDLLEVD